MSKDSLQIRFERRVDRSGGVEACHLWTGCILKKIGYGQISYKCKPHYTHRIAWLLSYGEIPDKLYVLHKCDNRPCVNPLHLFLGTHLDNIADMNRKGRGCPVVPDKGIDHHAAKLTEAEVLKIRELFAQGMSHAQLGPEFGVDPSNITAIVKRKTWKHI